MYRAETFLSFPRVLCTVYTRHVCHSVVHTEMTRPRSPSRHERHPRGGTTSPTRRGRRSTWTDTPHHHVLCTHLLRLRGEGPVLVLFLNPNSRVHATGAQAVCSHPSQCRTATTNTPPRVRESSPWSSAPLRWHCTEQLRLSPHQMTNVLVQWPPTDAAPPMVRRTTTPCVGCLPARRMLVVCL
jgi:hypothetical protein